MQFHWTTILSALIRFLLLGAQAAFASGILLVALMCIGGCGGYGEIIYGIMFGATVGVVTFIALGVHYIKNRNGESRYPFLRPKVQWIWLSISFFVLSLIYL